MSNKKDESSEDGELDQDANYNRNHGNQQKKRDQPGKKESAEDVFVIKSNTLDEGTMAFIHCKADDCAHVGFTICLEQLHGRGETLESIEAEADNEDEGTRISKENQAATGLSYYLFISLIASYMFFS